MAGLFGIGSSGAKTNRNQQLNTFGDLNSLFNYTSPAGQAQTTSGAGGLNQSQNYFSSLASGDPTKMAQVLGPQISAIQGQTQQATDTAAQFGNRSGGTNATIQNDQEQARTAVQSLFDMLGPQANAELASVSGQNEQLGQGLLGQATTDTSNAGSLATESQKQLLPIEQDQQSAVIQGLTSLAGL